MKQKSSSKVVKKCRMCLVENPRKEYLCLNESSYEELKIKFEKCFRVVIRKNPENLSYLCNGCVVSLDSFCKLQKTVQRNEKVYFERLRIRFKCDLCDYYSHKKCLLRNHIDHHHLKINFHICNICSKKFGTKYDLKLHIQNKHSDDYNFSCKLCPKKFKLKRYLNQHIKKDHS